MDFPNIPVGVPISLDYEASGLKYWQPDFQVFGSGIATGDAQWYFDFRDHPNAIDWLRDLIKGRLVIAQNAQYDYQCSRVLGMDPRDSDWYCTMVAECLIYEHHLKYDLFSICGYHGIDSQKKRHLDALQAAMGRRSHAEVLADLSAAPADLVEAYGSSDARDAYDVFTRQRTVIEDQNLENVLRRIAANTLSRLVICCRAGSVEDKRPVTVPASWSLRVWLKDV